MRGEYLRLFRSVKYTVVHAVNASDIVRESISLRERIVDDLHAQKRTAFSTLMMYVTQRVQMEEDTRMQIALELVAELHTCVAFSRTWRV